ncbi:FHA domain-containing protein [candidate division KSB1 bacterium]|nr:FHA domain-containing protein [candidate division KSB1 bacterium]
MLTLICQLGVNSGLKFEFQKTPLLIGRKDDNHLQIKSPYVSKQHAEIILDNNQQYWIKDLGSMNGTSVDNQPVSDLTQLNDGATITFGKNEIYKVCLSADLIREKPQNGEQLAESKPIDSNPIESVNKEIVVPEFRSASLSFPPVPEPAKLPVKRTTQPIAPSVPDEVAAPALQQPETPAKRNLDDSIFGLIDISTELKGHFQFQDQGQFEINDAMNYTEIYDAPEVLWPDIVQLKMKTEIQQKVFDAAKILLTAQDEYHIFDQLREIFPPILPFQNGLVVYHKNILTPEEWQKQFLGTPDFELYEATILAHQEHHVRTETQILPHQKLKTGMLYHPLLENGKIFGYINIVCAFEEGGFVERDRLLFNQICQLVEIALAKFLLL